jgi:metacaspase-1
MRRSSAPIKKAVLIGIDYINTPERLYGCQNDVNNMRKILIDKYRFNPTNIYALTDSGFKPTRANIINSINWLVSNLRNGDTLFFHYSGHGSSIADTSNDETDGRDEVIIPADFRQNGIITDDWLHQNMARRIPAGVRLFCFFDCCHSGTLCDLRYNFQYKRESKVPITPSINNYIQSNWLSNYNMSLEGSADTPGAVYMLSACQDNQYAQETVINNQPQGAFTQTIIEVLNASRINIQLIELLKELNCRLVIKGFGRQNVQLSVGRLELVGQTFNI